MKIRLLVATFLISVPSWAQTNDFLSWEQCLARAKAHNPDLVSARAAVRELEYGVASASSVSIPAPRRTTSPIATMGSNSGSPNGSSVYIPSRKVTSLGSKPMNAR